MQRIIFDTSAANMGLNILGESLRDVGKSLTFAGVLLASPVMADDAGTGVNNSMALAGNVALTGAGMTRAPRIPDASPEFLVVNTGRQIGQILRFQSYNQTIIEQIYHNKSLVIGTLGRGSKSGVHFKIGYKDPLNPQKIPSYTFGK